MKAFNIFTTLVSILATAKVLAHDAHEHGVAQLQIAVDGNAISFVLESPSESFYGFEHEAKSKADKMAMSEDLRSLKENMSQFVVLDPGLECKIKNTKLEVVKEEDDHDDDGPKKKAEKATHREEHHGEHREIRGEWQATCKKSPAKSTLQLQFSKRFSRIAKMRVDLLSDKKQIHHELKKGEGKIEL